MLKRGDHVRVVEPNRAIFDGRVIGTHSARCLVRIEPDPGESTDGRGPLPWVACRYCHLLAESGSLTQLEETQALRLGFA